MELPHSMKENEACGRCMQDCHAGGACEPYSRRSCFSCLFAVPCLWISNTFFTKGGAALRPHFAASWLMLCVMRALHGRHPQSPLLFCCVGCFMKHVDWRASMSTDVQTCRLTCKHVDWRASMSTDVHMRPTQVEFWCKRIWGCGRVWEFARVAND